MAVAPTGAIYKALKFDNTSSRNYGVYITGQAVYNAPERDVEMITIPARNGAFALDNGRFENIEVTYPAGIFADNEADFAQAISDFRNFLCSKRGYCRLEDEYNPDEYRMAIYKSGLEVSPAQLKAGEFEIVFECKPQRWLKSGETAVAYSNNDTITNPTLFDAEPLLAIKGYGTIGFNGYEINLENEVLGVITVASSKENIEIFQSSPMNVSLVRSASLNTGDAFTLKSASLQLNMVANDSNYNNLTSTITSSSGITGTVANVSVANNIATIQVSVPSCSFNKGTSYTYTHVIAVSGTYHHIGGYDYSYSDTLTIEVKYNGGTVISVGAKKDLSETKFVRDKWYASCGETTGNSTKSLLGNPTYIDCELGDAYKIESSQYVSLNHKVDLGSDLPKLASGNNTVTYDNTVTELKITPRWWKV